MKNRLLALLTLFFTLFSIQTTKAENKMPTLKKTFKPDFLIGAAIKKPLFEEKNHATLNLVARQFDSISSCNMLKWGPFNPKPGIYNHSTADAYVEFGNKNNMYLLGHVLFWHNQTPTWVFQDADGLPLQRTQLLKRMRERVKHVSQRYGNKIDAWDVVNESILNNGNLRHSQWTKIIGKDFIEQAFRIASDELPAGVELLYNDYSMTGKRKRAAVVKMIKELKHKKVRIDGVGMQGHWSLNSPSIADIEASIVAFYDAGVDVHITELDIDVLPRKSEMHGADVAKGLKKDAKMNPYCNGLPADMQQKLAQRYSDIFRLFLKHKDKIKRVTFWGSTDKYSWLNNWPIKGRTSYPLLFDRDGKPKPAFHAVIGLKDHQANISRPRTKKGAPDAATTVISSPATANKVDSARNHFLLLDSRIVAKAENARLVVGTVQKHKSNPLFGEDKPWEKRFDNLYGNVIFDQEEKIYKCWYSPFIVDNSAKGMSLEERDRIKYHPQSDKREMAICYATSKDGLKWEKPSLNQVEYQGRKDNNIVWRGPHGAGVFKDYKDPDPKRRYKMIIMGLATSYSADGIKWSEAKKITDIGHFAGDTHNNIFWDPPSQKYVAITRTWGQLGREVSSIESCDFETWTSNGVVMQGLEKSLQPYSMPGFFYGGVYIGLVAIHAQPPVDRVWTELAWSPDSKKWHRIDPGNPLIPCSEKKLEYDYGCVYPCAYPVFKVDQIQLYYGASDYYHFGWREGSLCLATLRPDGFAGYEQDSKNKPAVITTSSIPYAGQDIQISADIMKGGQVNVTIMDAEGEPISKAKTISKTVTNLRLTLSEKIDSQEIVIKFEATNAKLYSFSLAE